MAKVEIMNEDLANKIAAGEVVERTMNVVKELVENAIDAGATDIRIDLADSGVKEVRVMDNGKGMDKEDALLAFSRHATSKLKTLEDLWNIDSLGFRGEALPSIASVSKVTLKTSNGTSGTTLEINGGKIVNQESSDIRVGTIITVRDLFYNTPVRLKYLKNLYTELASITDYINKMALSFPNIKFVLKNNDKVLLNTDGSGRLLKVINDIYGLSVTKKMVEVNNSNNDYILKGYISYPEVMKSNKNAITVFINGRVIRNQELIRIITDCYHTYIPENKYPIVIFSIEVDQYLIDVNIHPTKMDIKFSKMDSLKELIDSTIKQTLEGLTLIPDVSLNTISTGNNTKVENHYGTYNNTMEFDASKKEVEYEEFEKLSLALEVKEEDTLYTSKQEERIKEMYPVGLVHGTYIVAENEDGMFLIDQHAANERINYEYYLEKLTADNLTCTDILIPISLEFPSNEYIILKERFDLLTSLGFGYEEFGYNTLIIRTIPMWLQRTNEEAGVKQIIDIIIEYDQFDKDKFFHKIAASVACKASIKANDFITTDDMRILLTRLRACKNPFTCPHGRPTIITYSKYELERLFKRAM
ncbi:MAG: DNA mismatch repair endonuclease MutL [Bacilli bacterium]